MNIYQWTWCHEYYAMTNGIELRNSCWLVTMISILLNRNLRSFQVVNIWMYKMLLSPHTGEKTAKFGFGAKVLIIISLETYQWNLIKLRPPTNRNRTSKKVEWYISIRIQLRKWNRLWTRINLTTGLGIAFYFAWFPRRFAFLCVQIRTWSLSAIRFPLCKCICAMCISNTRERVSKLFYYI